MDSVEILKQKLIDELVRVDGEINDGDLINLKKNAIGLGLDESQFNSLLKEAGNLARWKKRKKDKAPAPGPAEPHITVFDEKVVNLAQLGKVLFQNPLKAENYLRDDSSLKADVNYLTNNDVNKNFKVLKIYKSESDATKRYLKLIYYLDPSLPYRVGNSAPATIGELLKISFQNYERYKQVAEDFANGLLQIWLKQTNQADLTAAPGGNNYLSFLYFIYSCDATYPFYLNTELFATPAQLAKKAAQEDYLNEAIVNIDNSDALLIWLDAVEGLTKTIAYGSPDSAYQDISAKNLITDINYVRNIINVTSPANKNEPILSTGIAEPVQTSTPEDIEKFFLPKDTRPIQSVAGPAQHLDSVQVKPKPLTRLLRSSKGPIILSACIVAVIIGVLFFLIFGTGSRETAVPGQTNASSSSSRLYNEGLTFYQQKKYQNALIAFKGADSAAVNAKAECMIGNLYYMGLGVSQSDSTALKWYLKSAGQKNQSATYSLGLIYANGGKEVKRDILKAYQYLKWVAENATDETTKNNANTKLKEINEQ